MTLAVELGMRPVAARCHLGLGGLHRRSGDVAIARRHLETAAEMVRAMEMGYWLENVEAGLRELA